MVLRDRLLLTMLVGAGRCVQLILDNKWDWTPSPFHSMSTPTSFEFLLFLQLFSFFHVSIAKSIMKMSQSFTTRNCIGYSMHFVAKHGWICWRRTAGRGLRVFCNRTCSLMSQKQSILYCRKMKKACSLRSTSGDCESGQHHWLVRKALLRTRTGITWSYTPFRSLLLVRPDRVLHSQVQADFKRGDM